MFPHYEIRFEMASTIKAYEAIGSGSGMWPVGSSSTCGWELRCPGSDCGRGGSGALQTLTGRTGTLALEKCCIHNVYEITEWAEIVYHTIACERTTSTAV